MTASESAADTFKILLATDLHLGFKHLDPIRKDDSLNTLEEVLQQGRENDVDFILLGGDLFHENAPPRSVMYRCLQLLRKYCAGDTPLRFQFTNTELSHCTSSTCSSSLNISMPVFSIHSNHDEPTGPQMLSALDLVESSGLIHYFGKTDSIEALQVKPVLLEKGSTKLALYGIGSIRANKLRKMYQKKRVTMNRPPIDKDQWYNVLVIHQDRIQRSHQTHIEDDFIDDFVDLLICGHEHECQIKPKQSQAGKFLVTQPGSTIATQFKKSEMKPKHIGLLTISGREFQLKPISLRTVRQLYIEDLIWKQPCLALDELCHQKVDKLLAEAEKEREPEQPLQPLIRIRVQEAEGIFTSFSNFRFGLQYVGRVANPDSIVAFSRKVINYRTNSSDVFHPTNADSSTMTLEDILCIELQKETLISLTSEEEVLRAIKTAVSLNDFTIVTNVFIESLQRIQTRLQEDRNINCDDHEQDQGQYEAEIDKAVHRISQVSHKDSKPMCDLDTHTLPSNLSVGEMSGSGTSTKPDL